MIHDVEVQAIVTQQLAQFELEAYINSQADEIAPEIDSILNDEERLYPRLVRKLVLWTFYHVVQTV